MRTARWVQLLVAAAVRRWRRVLIWAGNVVAPGKGLKQGPFVTEEEIREMIDVAESDEVIEESERAMIHSIFELGDTVVREIMVPRPDMVTVSASDTLGTVLDTILRAGHSRIPVHGEDRDTIVGWSTPRTCCAGCTPTATRKVRGTTCCARRPSSRSSSRWTRCYARCRRTRSTWRSSSTSTARRWGW